MWIRNQQFSFPRVTENIMILNKLFKLSGWYEMTNDISIEYEKKKERNHFAD